MSTPVPSRRSTAAVLAALLLLAVSPPSGAQTNEKPDVGPLLQQWEKDVRARLDKNDKLKALAETYSLVVLHSRAKYAGGDYKHSAYSFIYRTSDEKKHFNDVQLLFDNGDGAKFQINMLNGQHNLVVELGKADFEKDPDPAKISIDHPGLVIDNAKAVEGNVYLERVRDDRGNAFYVVLQVVALDKDNRYMAFLWRSSLEGRSSGGRRRSRGAGSTKKLPPPPGGDGCQGVIGIGEDPSLAISAQPPSTQQRIPMPQRPPSS